jgi:hypothetical protein
VSLGNDELEQRAKTLYPDNEFLQRAWIEAVRFLRSHGGWILDGASTKWRSA